MNKNRTIKSALQKSLFSDRGRFTVLTGARQVGKSTLVKMSFPEIPVLSFDAVAEWEAYARFTPEDWISRYPMVILDEVQKAPYLFDTLKACYDRAPHLRYLLLGSSQVLLLKGVRETLAGRVALKKLFPFSIPELIGETEYGGATVWNRILACGTDRMLETLVGEIMNPVRGLSNESAQSKLMWEYYLHWGGMPALLNPSFTDAEKMSWLRDYQELYLQRDLSDLAKLADLEPFARLQKIAAMRSSQPVQYASLGAAAGVNAQTAKKYLHYLEISYQVHMLQPWFSNVEKRLVKSPKLHFLDPGIRRGILKRTGDIDGEEFESAVFSEAFKQSFNCDAPVDFYYVRTSDGREVDILVELENGYIGIECKLTGNVASRDARHFNGLRDIIDKPLKLGLVVSMDGTVKSFSCDAGCPVLAMPAWLLFGNSL
jgi:predicted AAA+ superfamily ATPase